MNQCIDPNCAGLRGLSHYVQDCDGQLFGEREVGVVDYNASYAPTSATALVAMFEKFANDPSDGANDS